MAETPEPRTPDVPGAPPMLIFGDLLANPQMVQFGYMVDVPLSPARRLAVLAYIEELKRDVAAHRDGDRARFEP